MSDAYRWSDRRRAIIGCAAACYVAALVIAAAAARLPDPRPQAPVPGARPAVPATPVGPRPDDSAAHPAAGAVEIGAVAERPRPTPVPEASENGAAEQDSFALAQRQHQAGDVAGAEATYLRLLREGRRRDEAARKLGELYVRAGDYRRAEAMYIESARLLRERQN